MLNKQITGCDILSLTSPLAAPGLKSATHSNSATFVINKSTCDKLKRLKDVPKTSLSLKSWLTSCRSSLLCCFTSQTTHCPFLGTTMSCKASQLSGEPTHSHLATPFHLAHSIFPATFTKHHSFLLPLGNRCPRDSQTLHASGSPRGLVKMQIPGPYPQSF